MDILQLVKRKEFTMKVVLMWTIHDFLAYGIVYGCQHQGYKACPSCGTNIISWWSKKLGKLICQGNQKWLWKNHPYRTHPNAKHFDGKEEVQGRPKTTIVAETLKCPHMTKDWVTIGNVLGAKGCPLHKTGVKHWSALFQLMCSQPPL